MLNEKQTLIFEDETRRILACAFEVLNELGHGLLEKPYENALTVEFDRQSIPFKQQQPFPVFYKGVLVGEYVPDLIVFDRIIVETKAIKAIGDIEKAQVINYLKLSNLRLGLILNFKNPRLDWKRVIL